MSTLLYLSIHLCVYFFSIDPPWQNGKVERSHREDGKILYGRKIFRSEKELKTAVKKHMQRYNSTAKTSLNFKSPNEIVSEYFSKCNICLDN